MKTYLSIQRIKVFIALAFVAFMFLAIATFQGDASQKKSPLTEEEQKGFVGCIEPFALTYENAFKYLHILVKGDPETIRYYSRYEKDENKPMSTTGHFLYQMDICTAVMVLSEGKNTVQVAGGKKYTVEYLPENKRKVRILSSAESKKIEESYNLILQVIREKTKYPRARLCAIKALSRYGELRDGKWYEARRNVPVLMKTLREKDIDIKLESAGVLLSLGRGDIALPVIEDVIKTETPQSISAINKLFLPTPTGLKLQDERGKKILIKALNHPTNAVRAYSALKLVEMGLEKEQAEDIAIKVLEELSDLRQAQKAGEYDEEERQRDEASGYYAIAVLEKTKSTKGINTLKSLAEKSNPDNSGLQKRAKIALENIQRK